MEQGRFDRSGGRIWQIAIATPRGLIEYHGNDRSDGNVIWNEGWNAEIEVTRGHCGVDVINYRCPLVGRVREHSPEMKIDDRRLLSFSPAGFFAVQRCVQQSNCLAQILHKSEMKIGSQTI